MPQDLCFLTAIELRDRVRQRELSVREVVEAHLGQIERVNPTVIEACMIETRRS